MLISITLLVTLTAVVAGGFGLSIRVWEAGHKKLENHYGVTEAMHLISRQIKTAKKLYISDELNARKKVAFSGDSASITFVSETPVFHSPSESAGPFLQKISFDPDSNSIVFKESLFFPHYPITGDFEGPELKMGAGKISAFKVEYYIRDPLVHESERTKEVYSWVDSVYPDSGDSFGLEDEMERYFIFPEAVRVHIETIGDDNRFLWPPLLIQIFENSEIKVREGPLL